MKHRIMIVKKEKCNLVGCGGYLCLRVSLARKHKMSIQSIGSTYFSLIAKTPFLEINFL